MNTWKIIWNVFCTSSSRWRVATEMWRLSSARQRVSIIASAILFLIGLGIYSIGNHSGLALLGAIVAEVSLLLVLDKIKDTTFFSEYGSPDQAMAPPDREEQRDSRYMIFRKRLREKKITKSHIKNAFPLADAKLDLEASRGEMPRKYLGFAIGLLAGVICFMVKESRCP